MKQPNCSYCSQPATSTRKGNQGQVLDAVCEKHKQHDVVTGEHRIALPKEEVK